MANYELLDGVEMNRAHPDTFEIPTDEEKAAVFPGDHVKLGFIYPDGMTERMWVHVTGPGPNIGQLDNEPAGPYLHWGMLIKFEPRHILAIIPSDETVQ